MSFKIHPEEVRALINRIAASEAQANTLKLRILEHPNVGYEGILHRLNETLLADYKTLAWIAMSPEMQRFYRSELGKLGGRHKKPPRRNPKLKTWVLEHAGTQTAGEICSRLERMERKELRKAIGRTKAPALKTIARILDGK